MTGPLALERGRTVVRRFDQIAVSRYKLASRLGPAAVSNEEASCTSGPAACTAVVPSLTWFA
jgi:hypothetical protein